MAGRVPRTTSLNFSYADFSVLNMDEYLQPLVANAKMNFHPNELMR
jgi:hypothetical protein